MTDPIDTSPVILFVDDEPTAVKYFQRAIGALAPVITAGSVQEGKQALDAHAETLAVLVSDQRMPGQYGNELLRYAKDRYPHMVRILTTAYSEMEHTVEAINQGQIHRYIKKPWEITALRMELKQALEFANMRKERDHLLREKIMVRQKQTVSNRIGTLDMICASLLGRDRLVPLETYLATALKVGVKAPEHDWLLMDYSDLVSAEAARNSEFWHLVRARLNEIEQAYRGYSNERVIDALTEIVGDKIRHSDGAVVFVDERNLTEFLETPSYTSVSVQHASWLAFLIWLDGRGCSLHTTRSGIGLQARLVQAESPISSARLAAWIEQF
jgi:two-component system probable response regulator PhcQ